MKNINFIRLHKMICNYCIHNKSEYSQQEIKKNIASHGVNVGNRLIFNYQEKITKFDEINIDHWPKRVVGDFENLNILYENDNFLAIYKPKNTVVEKGTGHIYDNIIHHLENKLGYSLFTVHRLDKDTSGVMLIAKSLKAKDDIQNLFRTRSVQKEYLALVVGEVEGIYNVKHYQSRDRMNMLRQKLHFDYDNAVKYSKESRLCRSVVKPIMYCEELNVSLVKVKILTGRMHQIRVLMESLGHPLLTDPVYNKDLGKKHSFVYSNYSKVNKSELNKFLSKFKSTYEDYFLCAVILSFTLNEERGYKNYAFNLMV